MDGGKVGCVVLGLWEDGGGEEGGEMGGEGDGVLLSSALISSVDWERKKAPRRRAEGRE